MRSRASAPPTPPKPSAGGSRPPTPKPGPPAPPPHPAPPTTTTPGRGRTRAREGQGTPRTTQARGHGRAPSEGRHTQGQGAGSDTTWGQDTTQEPGRSGNGDQDTEEKGTTTGATTHTDGETSAAPPPPHTPTHTTEANIGRHADHTSARPPATGNHTENGGHTYTGRTDHTHRGGRREHRRQPTTPTTTKANSQAPEEDESTAAAPTTTDRHPQRTRDQGTGPQGGQPHRPSRDHTMGYKGRAALPSRFDAEYCYGGLISAGLTSLRASVTNLLRPVEEWHCGGTPIPSMMNIEHRKGKRNAVIDREGFGAAGRCPPSRPSPSAVKTGSTKNTTDAPDPSSPAPEIWTSP